MAYDIDLSGQVAIITGGAKGIGAAITRYFAIAGADTYITGRRGIEDVIPFLDEIEKETGKRPYYVASDAGVEEDVAKIVPDCIAQFGQIDVLVTNAGGGKDFDNMFMVHMKCTSQLIEAAHPYLAQSKEGGRIVIIGSSTTVYGGRGAGVEYVSTKAGEIAMVRVYGREYAKEGIRVNGIYPSAIMSDMLVHGRDPKEVEEHYAKQMPLGKVGRPKDIAALTLFLSCEMSEYLDGQLYMVDGGRLILS